MQSLAVKYRPKTFDDCIGQDSIVSILEQQINTKTFKNAYLFCGPSGCGKTTLARIFANAINNNCGEPIEIDAASNNGVDNVRQITKDAYERSISSEYKVFIMDECHSLTNQSWQAFLKCIEETPYYTIFIFCTTDPQKIPDTILNRLMRFNFNRVKSDLIRNRLEYICKEEGYTNYTETIDYISKICKGQVRDSIADLEKVSSYSKEISIDNCYTALGNYSYDYMFNLIDSIVDCDVKRVIDSFNRCYDVGNDLKIFIDQFLSFVLDLYKYTLFNNVDVTSIPKYLESKVRYSINIENNVEYYSYIVDKVLNLKNISKNCTELKSVIETELIQIARCK